jgi:hypothetical protein
MEWDRMTTSVDEESVVCAEYKQDIFDWMELDSAWDK